MKEVTLVILSNADGTYSVAEPVDRAIWHSDFMVVSTADTADEAMELAKAQLPGYRIYFAVNE